MLRGIGPALAGNVGTGWAFALAREGEQGVDVPMLAAARSRSAWRIWALRGIRPARAEEALGRMGLSRCARGDLVIASKACCGLIPLRLAYWALRGNGPALAEEALGRRGFRAVRARGWDNIIGPRDYEGIGRKN